jgi:hypothetical protein
MNSRALYESFEPSSPVGVTFSNIFLIHTAQTTSTTTTATAKTMGKGLAGLIGSGIGLIPEAIYAARHHNKDSISASPSESLSKYLPP